ncbi:DoxX family protein [Streptomyces nodosus]|uniref:DoxX family protein n=1 Tax=Streptomyces nodosus TaxID=40318 RepID=A0A0B5DJI9_9ACTN|nr:DoxX family protein [Streptomyces nodosus]AJE43843.1 RpiR family transcriptional regulator [Streptomyces nodosus]MBB4795392.1 putative oxidoreductase [Streptomyces nodosus]QEV42346.1 DoxX family protein [Streptomyces nodosus]
MAHLARKNLGLLALRLGTGSVFFAHGAQKLFGWFGGGGLEKTAKTMEDLGFRPGRQSALAAGSCEAGGGLLLALGMATPVAGAAATGAMSGAVAVHRKAGFFVTSGGYEYPAYLGFVAACLSLAGPGRWSLDHLTGNRLNRPCLLLLSFAASAASAYVVVDRRERVLAAKTEPAETGD